EKPEDIYKVNPFERDRYIIAESKDSVSILNLDLNVKTEKNIYVSIDFNNLTRDRLFGEITADLDIKSSGNDINAVGSVNVVKDSYYRFYRNFKISDSKITFDGLITNPVLDIQAIYQGMKTTEQFGNTLNYPVEVKLTVKGQVDSPAVAITLSEDGSEVKGDNAQADAITYLLFGKYKSELSTSERKTMASSVGTTIGSLYITSFISQAVREVLPFLVDAQFNYTDGNVQNTDVEVTSEFGDLTVKVGGKLLKEVKNFEFTADYPLNKLLNVQLPETLIMEISREQTSTGGSANTQNSYTTALKIAYKIKF
ncbi:MAG: translocation/assembly module TamB domain-containing protein, partial [Ignavibacteria bacterium]